MWMKSSERRQTQKIACCVTPFMKCPEQANPREIDSGLVVARSSERGELGMTVNGYRVSLGQNALKFDPDGDCITLMVRKPELLGGQTWHRASAMQICGP